MTNVLSVRLKQEKRLLVIVFLTGFSNLSKNYFTENREKFKGNNNESKQYVNRTNVDAFLASIRGAARTQSSI